MSTPVPRPRGQQTTFTQEAADEICERLSVGEPLAQICRDERMPAYRTVYDWAKAFPDFGANIARARDEGYDSIALDCLSIADDKSQDVRFVGGSEDDAGREVCNTEFVQRAKLRIDTRLKLLAKWDPKRYGDKVAITGGSEDDAPIQHAVVDARRLLPDQRENLRAIVQAANEDTPDV